MNKKWDIQKVKEFVKINSDCTILSNEYSNTLASLVFKCECGEIFTTTWKQFSSQKTKKRQCNTCGQIRSNQSRIYNINEIRLFCSEIGVELLSDNYINCKTLLNFKCNCGNVFETTFDYMKNGNRKYCFDCQPKHGNLYFKGNPAHNLISEKDFLDKLTSKYGNEYELVSDYINVKKKIKLKHICGYIWNTNYDKVINGSNECPECFDNKNSKLSRKIQKWLEDNHIEYVKEFSFEDCFYKKPLKFDFAVFLKEKIIILIEADGEQHYAPFRFIKDEETRERKFKETQIRDNIKNDYCKSNDIPLIRIPYFKINDLETILNNNMPIPSQADENK